MSAWQVEAAVQVSPLVDNVMLHADPLQSHAVAVVVPNEPNLVAWAQEKGVAFKSFADLCNDEAAVAEVLKAVTKVRTSRHVFVPQNWVALRFFHSTAGCCSSATTCHNTSSCSGASFQFWQSEPPSACSVIWLFVIASYSMSARLARKPNFTNLRFLPRSSCCQICGPQRVAW